MRVINVKKTDADVVYFNRIVQKYILDGGFFPFNVDGNTAIFRRTKKLLDFLESAPFPIRFMAGKEVDFEGRKKV